MRKSKHLIVLVLQPPLTFVYYHRDKACNFPNCFYKAHTENELTLHIRRHTQEKPYKCEDEPERCSYASTDPAGLLRHRVSHHGYRPRRVHRPKAGTHRIPVSVLSQMKDNGDESASESFGLFRAGRNAGKRSDSDEEVDQLDSSSDESLAPRSFSGSAPGSAVPSPPSDSMVYMMMPSQPFYFPQVPQMYQDIKPSKSALDVALEQYPFHTQQLTVPPFMNSYPAEQSLTSLQGWNVVVPQVKLEPIEDTKFFNFAQDNSNYAVAGSSNTVQFDNTAIQSEIDFNDYLKFSDDEFGGQAISFDTLVNQTYIEPQPVAALQSLEVELDSRNWALNDVNVDNFYPHMTLDGYLDATGTNLDNPHLGNDITPFGQQTFDGNFSGKDFNVYNGYPNTYSQNNYQQF